MLDPNIGGLTTAMVDFTISRDLTFRMFSNEAGTRWSYEVTAPTWATTYKRCKWFNTQKAVEAATKEFAKNFNAAADEIEKRGYRDSIMGPMVQSAIFEAAKKIRPEINLQKI